MDHRGGRWVVTSGDKKITKISIFNDLSRCCPEAQADGVPCPELGRACEVCERAMRLTDPAGPSDRSDGSAGC